MRTAWRDKKMLDGPCHGLPYALFGRKQSLAVVIKVVSPGVLNIFSNICAAYQNELCKKIPITRCLVVK